MVALDEERLAELEAIQAEEQIVNNFAMGRAFLGLGSNGENLPKEAVDSFEQAVSGIEKLSGNWTGSGFVFKHNY